MRVFVQGSDVSKAFFEITNGVGNLYIHTSKPRIMYTGYDNGLCDEYSTEHHNAVFIKYRFNYNLHSYIMLVSETQQERNLLLSSKQFEKNININNIHIVYIPNEWYQPNE